MLIHFLILNDGGDLVLAAAEISAADRQDGFYCDAGYIPPYFMFDTEAEGLEVLHRLADETGQTVRSATH